MENNGFMLPGFANSLIVIVVVLLLYYILFVKWKVLQGRATASTSSKCSSGNCVRCNRYDIVSSEARKRFEKFVTSHGDDGLERIVAYFNDQSSLFASSLQNPNVLYVPGLRAVPLWSNMDIFCREIKLLERQWFEIHEEFMTVFSQLTEDSSGWKSNSTETGRWLVYCLYNQGEKIVGNCSKCPRTTAVVESMSSFMRHSIFGNVMFSVLLPGSAVSEHYGPCNVRIRCHLGW